MRKLKIFLTCFLIASVTLVHAQSKTVSGTVTSAEDGLPIIGASVVVKGDAAKGVLTDQQGKYEFTVNNSVKTLVVHYVGRYKEEVPALPNQKVVLRTKDSELDELLVVAYGTATKSSFTGSAATVGAEKLSQRSVSNVTKALAGQVAGVQTTSSTGQPGTSAAIRIRGIGSMSASNAPLIIVDGIPFDGSLSAINSQDIETMTVLKDAAANAIYGARGANGVVLVTTKKGETKEAVISVDAKWGNNSRAIPNYNVMTDPAMYYETYYKSFYNSVAYNGGSANAAYNFADKTLTDKSGLGYLVYTVPDGEKLIGTNFKLNPNAKLGYSDGTYYYTPDNWYKEMFNSNNLRQEYNLSISGASEKINYYLSAGFLDDTGVVANSGFTRFTGRSKVDYQAKEWLKVGSNLSYTNYDIKYPGAQNTWGSSGNLFYITNMIAPIYPMYVRDADGKIMKDGRGITVYDFGASSTNSTRAFMPLANPGVVLDLNKYHSYNDVLTSKWYATITPLEGLSLTANIGANVINSRSNNLYNQFYGSSVGSQGAVSVEHERYLGINQQYLANYKKKFAGVHNVELLAGFESYSLKTQYLGGSNTKLYNPYVGELNNAIETPPTVSSYTNNYATQGFLTRVQYDYDDKYFISGSYRADASSRFHPDNRWGNFGSLGASWLISKEDFMLAADWVDMLKLKASYGIQGNDNIGNLYAYVDQYSVYNNDGDFAVSFNYKGNKDITWETSYSFNTGVDFELFDSRLNGTIEYFSRSTVDLLYNQPVPISLGYDYFPMNVGSIVNNGVELDLNGTLYKSKQIEWTAFFNATHYKNKITDLADRVKDEGIKGSSSIYRIGGSLYNVYMREYAGVDKETGKALYYVDPDKGDRTTTDDYSKAKQSDLGSTLPLVYGGFGTQLNLYGFDVSVQLAYQLGGKIYDGTYEQFMHTGASESKGLNWHLDILNAWTPTNTDTDVPRINYLDKSYQYQSSRFLTSSDYLSLNSLVVGYTLPTKLLKEINISSMRVYVSGENIGLISARQGLDPRQRLGGGSSTTSGSFSYSALRSINAGVTLKF